MSTTEIFRKPMTVRFRRVQATRSSRLWALLLAAVAGLLWVPAFLLCLAYMSVMWLLSIPQYLLQLFSLYLDTRLRVSWFIARRPPGKFMWVPERTLAIALVRLLDRSYVPVTAPVSDLQSTTTTLEELQENHAERETDSVVIDRSGAGYVN